MGSIASSRHACTIGAKHKSVKFYFNFFFVGCGCSGVGAWVWVRGCGCVGREVGGRDGDGRARAEAGWIGIVAVGSASIASLGSPNPNSDCRLGCDR